MLLICGILLTPVSRAGEISADLLSVLQTTAPSTEIPLIVVLSDQADLRPAKEEKNKHARRLKIAKELKDKAEKTQGPLKAFLERNGSRRTIPLWLMNAIAATLPASRVTALAAFPGVSRVELDLLIEAPPVADAASVLPEWNISAIRAPELWSIGFAGAEVVVANTDTGVDLLHADLNGAWRGGTNSWYNPYSDPANASYCRIANNCSPCELSPSTPCDLNGHGTATMGVMVGGSAGGTAIGVAPDARWIAVKVLNDSRSGASSIIFQGFQWILDLPGAEAPAVVNNSWGLPNVNGCNTTYQTVIGTMKAAGIELVFSAGNSGPAVSSSVSPANNPGSYAVGATTDANTVASFSSRGPSACDASVFPQVVAPGANIRAAGLTNGGLVPTSYTSVSGTSFSAPHVAGAMALLIGAFPALTPADLESVLQETTNPTVGAPLPNNNYGQGLIDLANAYGSVFGVVKGNIPEIAASPSFLDFGAAESPALGSGTVMVVNRGVAAMEIGTVSVTGPDSPEFSIQTAGDTCSGQTIPPLSSCTVPVQFAASSVGAKSAFLSVPSDDPVQPLLDIPLLASVFSVIPGRTASRPAIAWNATAGKFHIAVRGADGGSIWVGSANSLGAFNNDWTRIPGATSDAPALAWNPASQKLYISVRGANGRSIWVGSLDSGGHFNNDWTQVPGSTSHAPAIAWNDDGQKLHIAVKGAGSSSIWVGSTNANGVFNNDWRQVPGSTSATPAITWNETAEKLHIAVRGATGGNIWLGSTNGSGVFNSDWNLIPGGTTEGPALAWNPTAGKLHIIVIGPDGSSIWAGTTDSGGIFNDDWTLLAGGPAASPSAAFNSQGDKVHILVRNTDNTIEEWATR